MTVDPRTLLDMHPDIVALEERRAALRKAENDTRAILARKTQENAELLAVHQQAVDKAHAELKPGPPAPVLDDGQAEQDALVHFRQLHEEMRDERRKIIRSLHPDLLAAYEEDLPDLTAEQVEAVARLVDVIKHRQAWYGLLARSRGQSTAGTVATDRIDHLAAALLKTPDLDLCADLIGTPAHSNGQPIVRRGYIADPDEPVPTFQDGELTYVEPVKPTKEPPRPRRVVEGARQ